MAADPVISAPLKVTDERWPIRGHFAISRGSKSEAHVVVAEIEHGGFRGRGECVPYARYGETVAGVAAAIGEQTGALARGLTRAELMAAMPPGAARNALDCALWDLGAKAAGQGIADFAGLPPLKPVQSVYTLSLDTAEAMAAAAGAATDKPILKLKLGGAGDEDRLRAVRAAAPGARLVIDANEGWDESNFSRLMDVCAETGVELVEQPLPTGHDGLLETRSHKVPVCADEAVHGLESLAGLAGRYDAINIKLDKTGGLTEALVLAEAARRQGYGLMTGCMLATSLAMAPALVVAQLCDFVDLDGPLLLARDREPGLVYEGALVHPPAPELWG